VSHAYQSLPISRCRFDQDRLDVRIGDASLDAAALRGACEHIAWDLRYAGSGRPLLLYPAGSYERALPAAKVLDAFPDARYDGTVSVAGETHAISQWPGMQGHNWGRRHTDLYAWAQVAGFDGAPDALFEGATARIKLGPLWTPHLTSLVLRLGDEDHSFNTPLSLLRNRGRFAGWRWSFEGVSDRLRMEGEVTGDPRHFAALQYRNPPGGSKRCLNSKIARCELRLRFPDGGRRTLVSSCRSAFEILGDPAALLARGFR
jgi:hypothetical protein